MKAIKIKSLKLTNFKGIRSLEINDLSQETSIFGDNGTGKTTVFDAFTFLMFGKDSTDRKDFEIKTLDKNNNVIPKIDHVVEATIEVNNEVIELRRTLKEKWVTKRGSTEAEFTGNETQYEWNGVPMNAGEFSAKINTIVDEKVFKMITNPSAFNSLKWQDQRDVLIDMSGNVTDFDVAKGNPEFEALVLNLTNKSLDERKREVKASMTKSKNEIKTIPTRIDEVERSKPTDVDFEGLKRDLEAKTKAIEAVNDQVSDKLKAQQADIDKQTVIQREVYAIETEINSTKHKLQQEASEAYQNMLTKPREIQRKIDAVDADIRANDATISNGKSRIGSYKNHEIANIDKIVSDLRKEWEAENATQFKMDADACACPTCKRDFDTADVEEKRKDLQDHFLSNKTAKLKSITEKGKSYATQKQAFINNITALENEVSVKEAENVKLWETRADLSKELETVSISKTQDQLYNELLKAKEDFFTAKNNEIATKKEALNNRVNLDVSSLKEELNTLNYERDAIKTELQKEAQIKQADQRIEQLLKEEKALAQAIADIERELFIIEAFEKEKSNRIEESVNQRFQFVNFRLFETQINGGEVPTCKALINGVPYSDANTASKINAGIDIINTLCMHYKASAPIFIDNRESVVELINTDSQIINLIVSEADSKLRVESGVMSEAV